MFFMFGIYPKEKDLDFRQTTVCPSCGSYRRYEAFMRYSNLSLFFIPVLKWNNQYFIRTSCCNSLYELNSELGGAIERGENVTINEGDLTPIYVNYHRESYCSTCGYRLESDFEYCPKCGRKL